jgi:AbrB family looped-hinge helix DNA binding protein
MKEQAKITSKGQITVPKRVRQSLGVEPGDSIVFEDQGDKVVVRPVRSESPFDKYRGIHRKGRGLSRDEIVRSIRELRDGGSD